MWTHEVNLFTDGKRSMNLTTVVGLERASLQLIPIWKVKVILDQPLVKGTLNQDILIM